MIESKVEEKKDKDEFKVDREKVSQNFKFFMI